MGYSCDCPDCRPRKQRVKGPTVVQRGRLFDCLNRFVRAEDASLSDADLVLKVFQRWSLDRGVHLGDPGDGVDLTGVFNDKA